MPQPYSYSRLKTFLACPAQYRMKYIDRLPEPVIPIAQAGKLAHAVFEAYAAHCIASDYKTDLTELPEIARNTFETMRAEARAEGEPFLSEAEYADLVRDVIAPFGENHMFDATLSASWIEWQLALDGETQVDFDDPSAQFRGVIDYAQRLSDGSVAVVDYKTGFAAEVDPLQMQVYAWMLMRLGIASTVTCTIDFVRFNVQRTQTFTAYEDYEPLDGKITSIIAAIDAAEAAGDMPHTPGPHCLHCPYADRCEARAVPPDVIADADSARQAVEALALLERDTKRLKDALREWCVEHGSVQHNGAVWGHHGQGGDGFDDPRAFVEAAQAAGVDPWRYLSVDNTATKKLTRDARFKPLLVNRRRVQFGMRKAKEAAE